MDERRICFIGDSLTAGTGDAEFLGWPGRLCRREAAGGRDITLYNLGVRADTTRLIAQRWRAEALARLPAGVDRRLVFCFGVNDMAEEKGAGLRVPAEVSVAVAREMIADARTVAPVLWIGPPPVVDARQPFQSPTGQVFAFDNARTRALSKAYAVEAADLGVPYLEVFDSLAADPVWSAAQEEMDGVHPAGDGYARFADLVHGWAPWRAWMER